MVKKKKMGEELDANDDDIDYKYGVFNEVEGINELLHSLYSWSEYRNAGMFPLKDLNSFASFSIMIDEEY